MRLEARIPEQPAISTAKVQAAEVAVEKESSSLARKSCCTSIVPVVQLSLAMHEVKRSTAPTASAKAARKEKEAAQLKTYLEVEAAFFEAVSERGAGALLSSASAF